MDSKNSGDSVRFPPQNESDEEQSPDEELNAESESERPRAPYASSLEPEEEVPVEEEAE